MRYINWQIFKFDLQQWSYAIRPSLVLMLIVHIWIVLGLAANANSTVYIFTVTHKKMTLFHLSITLANTVQF